MTHPLLGRYHAPEPLSALARLHIHRPGTRLTTVDHEPRVAVLDQSDLLSQGIRCSQLIPGAQDVDALGSCTANTVIEAVSRILPATRFAALLELHNGAPGYTNTAAAETAAIRFYHGCTSQTGDTATEWPPTDCGSSGPHIESYAQRLGLISTARIAHGADSLVSVMQADGALLGMPWFESMFTPDAHGFVDGDGSAASIEAAIQSGVAGGHEVYLSAIESLTVLPTGHVDPFRTVVRFRNHWKPSWGDNGSGRLHLSTLAALGASIDARQFVA